MSTEDRRAHERINELTGKFARHLETHEELERSIKKSIESAERTEDLAKKTADNTSELVKIFKGAKAMRSFFLWASPIVAFLGVVWAALKWLAAFPK